MKQTHVYLISERGEHTTSKCLAVYDYEMKLVKPGQDFYVGQKPYRVEAFDPRVDGMSATVYVTEIQA